MANMTKAAITKYQVAQCAQRPNLRSVFYTRRKVNVVLCAGQGAVGFDHGWRWCHELARVEVHEAASAENSSGKLSVGQADLVQNFEAAAIWR
jgi:hypothetical protein